MNIVIHTTDSLVFRDGRPFGDPGHVNGGMLRWPWPSTVVGMLRNRIGLSWDPNYFQTDNGAAVSRDKIKALESITADRVFPLWRENGNSTWQHLFPAPADALLTRNTENDTLQVHNFSYEDPFDGGGIDLPWQNWKIPLAKTREKPAADSPDLWFEKNFFFWLKNNQINDAITAKKLGLSLPLPDVRMHTAIDPVTGTVKTGQLFSSEGICMATEENDYQKGGRFGIGVHLQQTDPSYSPYGPCYFGGERRVAFVDPLSSTFPACPEWFTNARYLRLILLTPGDFGSWAPDWLIPDKEADETGWRQVPGSTDMQVRLCSAFIPRWQPVSGWDYVHGGPKATRKLVPAGAVYVVELQNSEQSQALAQHLWGRSIAENQNHPNGCGAVCIGNITI